MRIDPDLADALEVAAMDALRGEPPGPAVAKRLEREIRVVLDQHGLSGARVLARSDHTGTVVRIRLPRPDQTVQEIKLDLR